MSNYATLKAAISTAIKQNGNEEITGQVLQTTLLSMVDSLVSGYLFKGIATPSTVVGTPDENVFWLAPAGSYSNFGATPIDVPTGCIGIFQYNGSFTNTVVYVGGTVDISALSHTAYASLSQALGDVPAALHIGGIEIQYQDSTSGKYMKYRLIATSWSTLEEDWVLDKGYEIAETYDYISVVTDTIGRVLAGLLSDGTFEVKKIKSDTFLDYVKKEAGKQLTSNDFTDDYKAIIDRIQIIDNNEWLYVILDKNDKILWGIKVNGEKYKEPSSLSSINAVSPKIIFDVWNTMGWNGTTPDKSEYTREYMNTIYPDRMYIRSKAKFGGVAPWKVLSNTTRWRASDTAGQNVLTQVLPFTLESPKEKRITKNLSLITTKNNVAIGQNVTLMSIGDSITDANADFWDKTGNWTYESFVKELFQMDDIDYQEDADGVANSIQCHLVGIRNNIKRVVSYRGHEINHTQDNHEGRGGWAATEYLRYPVGGIRNIKGLYDILGLRSIYGSPDTLSLIDVSDKAANTCWGVNTPDITQYSWDAFKSYIGYSNVTWANATEGQKQELLTWASVTVVNEPYNPFYDKTAYDATLNSMFSWNAYYARYKNYENDAVTPLPVGEQGTNVQAGSVVCVPKFFSVCLGANDGIYKQADGSMSEVYAIATILRQQTNAKVIVFCAGYPASLLQEYHSNMAEISNNIVIKDIEDAWNRNKNLMEMCGSQQEQQTNGIFYCPAFFVQGFDTSRTHKDESLNADFMYSYSWCYNDIHPGLYAHQQIGYQLYSLIMYLLTL